MPIKGQYYKWLFKTNCIITRKCIQITYFFPTMFTQNSANYLQLHALIIPVRPSWLLLRLCTRNWPRSAPIIDLFLPNFRDTVIISAVHFPHTHTRIPNMCSCGHIWNNFTQSTNRERKKKWKQARIHRKCAQPKTTFSRSHRMSELIYGQTSERARW